MKKIILILSTLFLSFALFAQVKVVNAEDFEKQLKTTKSELLIDVRTPQEFTKSHLKNAINIDFRSPDFREKIEKLDKTQPVFVYCAAGRRSNAAAVLFLEAGFRIVFDLEGGLNAWVKTGKNIEQ